MKTAGLFVLGVIGIACVMLGVIELLDGAARLVLAP